jgi:ATP-dependent RNA helicase SUPV3L1/SUV3
MPDHDTAVGSDGIDLEQEKLVTIWHLPHRERPANRRNHGGRRGASSRRSEAMGQNGGHRDATDGKTISVKRNAGKSSRRKKRDAAGDDRHASAAVKPWQDRKADRKENRIDPDSPFAKLLALKKQLEKGDG